MASEWPDVAAACHYLGHLNGMKTAMTVEENLRFWRDFLGCPHLELWEALEMVGLGEIGHLPYGYLSTGQRRRVADRPAAGELAAHLAARRADGRARQGLGSTVRRR